MTAEEIKQYLAELDEELRLVEIKGEVSLFGGAVMCLAFEARPATKDVDAIFRPVAEIRKAIEIIADRHGLPANWMNDAVKGYWAEHRARPDRHAELNGVCAGARLPSGDESDRRTRRHLRSGRRFETYRSHRIDLGGRSFCNNRKVLSENRIKPVTQYFIEELFEK